MSSKISPRGSTKVSTIASPRGCAPTAFVAAASPRAGDSNVFLQDHLQADVALVEAKAGLSQERALVWDSGQTRLHSPRDLSSSLELQDLHSPRPLPSPRSLPGALEELQGLILAEARKQEMRHKEVLQALRARARCAFREGSPQGLFHHDEPPVRKWYNAHAASGDFLPEPGGGPNTPASVWLASASDGESAATPGLLDRAAQLRASSPTPQGPEQQVQDDNAFCEALPRPAPPPGGVPSKSSRAPASSASELGAPQPSRVQVADLEDEARAPAGPANDFIGANRYSSDMTHSSALRITKSARSTASSSSRFSIVFKQAHHEHHHHHHAPCYIMHPDSSLRFVLDTSSLLMLLLDSVLVPYQIAWDVSFEGIWLYLTWFTCVYWTLDMCIGFFAGYYEKGELHLGIKSVCRHYLRGAFIPNFAATVCDLAALILAYQLKDSGALGVGKLPRLIKLHRVIRLVAILRTGKAARVYDAIAARFEQVGFGSSFRATVQVVNITFFLMWLNHIGACVWHVFAHQATSNWYQEVGIAEVDLTFFDYLLAYCWSTSALLAGESIMVPSTEQELIIAIVFILFGLITSSIIIGYISDTLIDFRISNKDRMDQIWVLRKYMKQSQVPFSLASNLEKEALEVQRTNKRVVEEDVKLLKNISPGGREKLNALVFGKVVCHDRFLRACHGLSRSMIRDICANAISHVMVEPGTMAFEFDTEAEGAYLVHWGRYDYMTPRADSPTKVASTAQASASAADPHREDSYAMISHPAITARHSDGSPMAGSEGGSTPSERRPFFAQPAPVKKKTSQEDASPPVSERPTLGKEDDVAAVGPSLGNLGRALNHESVKECQWFCQLALFYHTRHIGSMQAIAVGEHLILSGERLHNVLQGDARLFLLARDYSRALVDAIRRRYDKRAISELCLPMPHENILPLMPEVTRALMSQAALDKLLDIWSSFRARQELTAEVSNGQCDLLIDTRLGAWNQPLVETVLRVVSVVVLRLRRQDGLVLCQLGKFKDDECKASLRLPGIKVGHGELPSDALRRMMAETVEPLKAGIQLGEKEVLEEVKNSASYKIKTKYVRSVFHAVLDSGTEFTIRRMEVDATKLAASGDGLQAGKVKSAVVRHPGKKARQPSRNGTRMWGAVRSAPAVDQDVAAFLLGEENTAASNLHQPVFAWLDPDYIETPESLEAKEASIRLWAPALVVGHEQRVNSMLTLDAEN